MSALAVRARSIKPLAIALIVAAVILAAVVSNFASSKPDGLEKTAGDAGITSAEREHAVADGPLADYQTRGVDEPWLSGGLAGVIGVLAVGALGCGLFLLIRPRRSDAAESADPVIAGEQTL